MEDYYRKKLSAERLRKVYEIASPRIRQYLEAEIDYVITKLKQNDRVIELGCGYGRVLDKLSGYCSKLIGIDVSMESLIAGKEYLKGNRGILLAGMNADRLGFSDCLFDAVICIQNGISAFHVDQLELVNEAYRITRENGRILFSSYSGKFWDERLRWFEDQAAAGLLGAIDYEKTGDGVISCEDGFTATTLKSDDFQRLTSHLNARIRIFEIDNSSLFCEIIKNEI